MTIDAPEIIVVEGGTTAALKVRVHYSDGTPAKGYVLTVYADCADGGGCTMIVAPGGQGAETIYAHGVKGSFGTMHAYATPADGDRAQSESHRILFIHPGAD